jgi:hypothetical protein
MYECALAAQIDYFFLSFQKKHNEAHEVLP